ncbi:hypothetical protein DPMN_160010 [Dreissena polymorpha]|uniref:Uncharacterized protein n=1 Tax=Dreissena polymorpha TaxID=45954 RepID=A0A9D4EMG0_DREPO|nr:hypothetical protein DPMN_160010 [Dreissena polymorpha]
MSTLLLLMNHNLLRLLIVDTRLAVCVGYHGKRLTANTRVAVYKNNERQEGRTDGRTSGWSGRLEDGRADAGDLEGGRRNGRTKGRQTDRYTDRHTDSQDKRSPAELESLLSDHFGRTPANSQEIHEETSEDRDEQSDSPLGVVLDQDSAECSSDCERFY